MNSAHFHLMVNHFPLIFPVVGIMVLIGGYLVKSEVVKRVAYLIFIAGTLSTFLALASGEEAEEVIEDKIGVSENYIHQHEEAAKTFSFFNYLLGGISSVAFSLSMKKNKYATYAGYIAMVICLFVFYFGKQTGTTGGEIIHSEIRQTNANPNPSSNNSTTEESNGTEKYENDD